MPISWNNAVPGRTYRLDELRRFIIIDMNGRTDVYTIHECSIDKIDRNMDQADVLRSYERQQNRILCGEGSAIPIA